MNSACGLVIRCGDVTWRSGITHNPLNKILCRYARATIESNPSTLLKSSSEEKYSVGSSNLVWSELLAEAFKSKVRLFCLFEWCCLQRSWNLILAWLHVKMHGFSRWVDVAIFFYQLDTSGICISPQNASFLLFITYFNSRKVKICYNSEVILGFKCHTSICRLAFSLYSHSLHLCLIYQQKAIYGRNP